MKKQVNIAVQIIPRANGIHPYDIVDKAIEVIKQSGVNYMVCPFETVMEGEYDKLMQIIEKIHETCFLAGAEDIICNIKIQSNKLGTVAIEDKMHKYR